MVFKLAIVNVYAWLSPHAAKPLHCCHHSMFDRSERAIAAFYKKSILKCINDLSIYYFRTHLLL